MLSREVLYGPVIVSDEIELHHRGSIDGHALLSRALIIRERLTDNSRLKEPSRCLKVPEQIDAFLVRTDDAKVQRRASIFGSHRLDGSYLNFSRQYSLSQK